MEKEKTYIAIDLKSFYASVECIDRGLDPLTTNLVVADAKKSEKSICLAVTPTLKKYGISSRARLFEVNQKVREINNTRRRSGAFLGKSYDDTVLQDNNRIQLDYIAAIPRMAYYLDYSNRIYEIYLKYISPQDIHVYSIDEVFIDATSYLNTYKMTASMLAKTIILDILKTTGITATAGIGTNLYLCKIAMDILAKKSIPDKDGVLIASLDEMSYRTLLWDHKPLTDFWRVGKGYAKKLMNEGIFTMKDIARCSIGDEKDYLNEDLLYEMFGVNAELLIDHAWGYEPCTMKDIKSYKPLSSSIGVGQVLDMPYTYPKAKIIVTEMLDGLALDLVSKSMVCNQLTITIGYDRENQNYKGDTQIDPYGRTIPKHTRITVNFNHFTASSTLFQKEVLECFEKKVNKELTVRRINMSANHIKVATSVSNQKVFTQINLFDIQDESDDQNTKEQFEKEKKIQEATLKLKQKYGKNAVLKAMNLQEGANARKRNKTIGGHKA